MQHGIYYPAYSPNQEHRDSRRSLHSFLEHVRWALKTQRDQAVDLEMMFPMDGEATEEEEDDEDKGDEDEEDDDDEEDEEDEEDDEDRASA